MYQMALGYQELLIVLVILLLLFGSTRLPQLAKGLGKSIREFKRGVTDDEEDEALAEAHRREALPSKREILEEDNLASSKFTVNKPR